MRGEGGGSREKEKKNKARPSAKEDTENVEKGVRERLRKREGGQPSKRKEDRNFRYSRGRVRVVRKGHRQSRGRTTKQENEGEGQKKKGEEGRTDRLKGEKTGHGGGLVLKEVGGGGGGLTGEGEKERRIKMQDGVKREANQAVDEWIWGVC